MMVYLAKPPPSLSATWMRGPSGFVTTPPPFFLFLLVSFAQALVRARPPGSAGPKEESLLRKEWIDKMEKFDDGDLAASRCAMSGTPFWKQLLTGCSWIVFRFLLMKIRTEEALTHHSPRLSCAAFVSVSSVCFWCPLEPQNSHHGRWE
jgi:hypothetical protein